MSKERAWARAERHPDGREASVADTGRPLPNPSCSGFRFVSEGREDSKCSRSPRTRTASSYPEKLVEYVMRARDALSKLAGRTAS